MQLAPFALHCEDTRQYLDKDCFLAPPAAAGSSDRSGGTVAVVAGLIAAVKLARVESIELQNRSLRVRSSISDSISLARMSSSPVKRNELDQAKAQARRLVEEAIASL